MVIAVQLNRVLAVQLNVVPAVQRNKVLAVQLDMVPAHLSCPHLSNAELCMYLLGAENVHAPMERRLYRTQVQSKANTVQTRAMGDGKT